jgi:3-deoxy-D-manno-octulosonate 8-phosphate phosphatase (KDO 8-P phosphatase)
MSNETNYNEAIVDTLYQPVSAEFFEKCKKVKLVVFDVDGVFSDGQIYLGNNNEELKAFNTKDGYGVKALSKCGVMVAVITGRKSQIVEQRMRALNVRHLLQGREDKQKALAELMRITGYQSHQIASVGDDMPDLEMFHFSEINIATQDAHPLVKRNANYVTSICGGKGAVREVCDLFLQAKGKLDIIHGASI